MGSACLSGITDAINPSESSPLVERPARQGAMRKSCSTPALSTLGITEGRLSACSVESDNDLNVYVVARPIRRGGGQVFQQLPEDVKLSIVALGVCHYMTVFETSDGRLVQFDFGPAGGDIQKGAPVSWLAGCDTAEYEGPKEDRARSRVAGEIRERQLDALPETCIFVGRTPLRLSDIRSYNESQCLHYELHKNDCRHYVNSLVEFTTGVPCASKQLVKDVFQKKYHQVSPWNAKAAEVAHYVTDVGNWSKVKAASGTTMATLLAWTSRGLVGRVAANTLTPALRAVSAASIGTKFIRKPVGGAAVAVATSVSSWGDVPIVRETMILGSVVNRGVMSMAGSAVGWVDWMRTQNPVHAFVDLAMTPSPSPSTALGSNVVKGTAALAVAMSRGAAGLLLKGRESRPASKERRQARHGRLLRRHPQLGEFRRHLARPALETNR